MPQLLMILLMTLLVTAGLAMLAVASWRRGRRRARLAKLAADLGFRYSREDPFEIPRRYAEFVLVAAGHSPVVTNMISGHVEGMAVRAFDFQYEVGHGARRMARQYGAILLETGSPLPRLLMWHNGDSSPVSARQAAHARGPFSVDRERVSPGG